MKLHLKALAVGLLLAISALPAFAASPSAIPNFLPGPRLIDGSQLNLMVARLNGIVSSPNQIIGTGVNQVSISGSATTVDPVITVGGTSSDTNIGLLIAGKGTGPLHLGGSTKENASVRVVTVASSVNELTLQGAATGVEPQLTIGGVSSDTNIGVAILGKGTGNACLGGTTCANAALQAVTTASAVDFLSVTGSATGTPGVVALTATGTDTNVGATIAPKGSGVIAVGGTIATCSGTTTATCQGQRFVVSITGLSTAASTLSAAMVVTDASVVSSSSIVMCQPQGYAGTGVPVAVNVTPGTGSLSVKIQNVSTGAALNATVAVACFVYGT